MLTTLRRSLASSNPLSLQQLQLLAVTSIPSLSNGFTSQLGSTPSDFPRTLRVQNDVASPPLPSSSPHRTLFSLPGFEDDLAKKYRERKLLGYSPQQMFDVVAAVEYYNEFVPWCQRSTVILRRDEDKYLEAELEVGFQIFVEQ